jgi:glycogen synthase
MKNGKPYLFEASWEVCNKVGGIYTVLESKSQIIKNQYGDNYFLLGPYLEGISENQFHEKSLPKNLEKVAQNLLLKGIKIHFGTWLIESEPQVILVEFNSSLNGVSKIKSSLWDWYAIDSLYSSYDFDEPIAWSWAVGKVVEEIKNIALPKEQVILQCHEWMAGGAILYIKKTNAKVATIFTTHATFLGRVLASHGVNFYKNIKEIDPDLKARDFGIVAKFSAEKAVATEADVFTTVSDITALEAEHFLKRRPDIVLPNGLNLENFSNVEDAAIKHIANKGLIKEFISYHFFPYYNFDLDNTLVYFLFGRYEMHAKGIDLFIDSLVDLNKKLIETNSKKNVVAFFAVPSGIKGVKKVVAENKAAYLNIKHLIDSEIDTIHSRLIRACVGEYDMSGPSVFPKDLRPKIFSKYKLFKKEGLPSILTHDLDSENNDPILNKLKEVDLTNKQEDKVKVVSCPTYLNGTDGILNMNFYDFMSGAHLGVFPSFYEPWGYTPLESAALGVASITSDLSGFGLAVNNLGGKKKLPGVYVLERANFDYKQEVKGLSALLFKYSQLDKDERMISRVNAKELAKNYSWQVLARNYFEAQELAISKINLPKKTVKGSV